MLTRLRLSPPESSASDLDASIDDCVIFLYDYLGLIIPLLSISLSLYVSVTDRCCLLMTRLKTVTGRGSDDSSDVRYFLKRISRLLVCDAVSMGGVRRFVWLSTKMKKTHRREQLSQRHRWSESSITAVPKLYQWRTTNWNWTVSAYRHFVLYWNKQGEMGVTGWQRAWVIQHCQQYCVLATMCGWCFVCSLQISFLWYCTTAIATPINGQSACWKKRGCGTL